MVITIQGKDYPCRLTPGAIVRFKRATGKTMDDFTSGKADFEDNVRLLFECVASASRADQINLDFDCDLFMDMLDVNEIVALQKELFGISDNQSGDDPQKKTEDQ